jgi:hypothetical protein
MVTNQPSRWPCGRQSGRVDRERRTVPFQPRPHRLRCQGRREIDQASTQRSLIAASRSATVPVPRCATAGSTSGRLPPATPSRPASSDGPWGVRSQHPIPLTVTVLERRINSRSQLVLLRRRKEDQPLDGDDGGPVLAPATPRRRSPCPKIRGYHAPARPRTGRPRDRTSATAGSGAPPTEVDSRGPTVSRPALARGGGAERRIWARRVSGTWLAIGQVVRFARLSDCSSRRCARAQSWRAVPVYAAAVTEAGNVQSATPGWSALFSVRVSIRPCKAPVVSGAE